MEQLSPRLQKLKDELVQWIPMEKATSRMTLASKHLTDIVIQYLTWKARMIRPRPRTVVEWPDVAKSKDYPAYAQAIGTVKAELERGDDVTARLSALVRKSAYVGDLPRRTAAMTNDEWVRKMWKGKDRVRVIIDAHHLHLGNRNPDGTVIRTGPLLFVGVTLDRAFLLTLGDHDSFDDGTVSKLMHDKLDANLGQAGGGAALAGPGVTAGGTQVKDTFRAIAIVKKLHELDGAEGLGSDREFHLDWDDIVVVDAKGSEVHRHVGLL